ncbi:MAG: hypothetical protein IPP31_10430 [Chitinophagaceae bacterium]|nr:hypothetical protein [Chitinophagaceae bacterium]
MSYTANLEIDNEDFLTLSLNGVEFYCPYSKSSNSQYILAFDDRDAVSGRGGHRENGKGCYFLIKDHAIIVIGQVERPNDGKLQTMAISLSMIGYLKILPKALPTYLKKQESRLFENYLRLIF